MRPPVSSGAPAPPSLPWRLVAGLAWRETRGAWRHFAGFLACIALGVGALVAVLSVAASIDRSLGREARALLGGTSSSARPAPSTPRRRDRSGTSRAAARPWPG